MTSILPADYSQTNRLPQALGKAGNSGTVLQVSYLNDNNQLLLDRDLATRTTVRVTGYSGVGEINPESLSFSYKSTGDLAGTTIPVSVVGQPELQPDGSYLITTEIPPLNETVNGYLVANYVDGATSDGLEVLQAPYPPVPEGLENDGASRQILLDYENLLDALAPPNTRSNTGTVQSSFSKKGLNALENKDDKKRREAVQGAVQQAVSRIRGLSEVLVTNHLGDELAKLQTWANTITLLDVMTVDADDIAATVMEVIEYTASVSQDLVKLTTILEQYSIGLKGTTASQNSGVVNQAAQAFRFTSNSVYDIEAPTTLLNTEFLIQQSSKATYRQTGIDQLSCFNSWQRAEDMMTRQAKSFYNYATDRIYNGAETQVGTFDNSASYCNETYKVQTGKAVDKSSFVVTSEDSIDLFSVAGSIFSRAVKSIIHRTADFITTAKNSIFMQSEGTLALESEQDLHLVSHKGRIVIDADDVIFRTKNPVQFYMGDVTVENPLFIPWYVPRMALPIPRPDLLMIPRLEVFDVNDLPPVEEEVPIDEVPAEGGTSIAVEGPPGEAIEVIQPEGEAIEVIEPPEEEVEEEVEEELRLPLYLVEGLILTAPKIKPVILPQELLEYPKAASAATVPQPNNGVVSSPVYPAA